MGLSRQRWSNCFISLKKWVFRLVLMVLVPVLVFSFLEWGLRFLEYGFSPDFFVHIEGRNSTTTNQKFGRRFFSSAVARVPEPCVLPDEKEAGTYRIFILGGSAALGTPDAAFGFGRVLEVMLKELYSGVRFEVINSAMTAVNSHVILPISRDCADRGANLFVIYMGNNEVVGPYGPGTVFKGFSPSLMSIRAGIQLRSFRTGQLFEEGVRWLMSSGDAISEWQGMGMFLNHLVKSDDLRLEGVYHHFRQNLNDICEIAVRAGTKVIVCTIGTNLKDNPPFASVHRDGMTEIEISRWDHYYDQGIKLVKKGRYKQALTQFLEASYLDNRFAELHFYIGRCYLALGIIDKARERFVQARDLDALRFRADTRINQIIRETVEERESQGIYLVDSERSFENSNLSPQGITGRELFYEHVHPKFEGNYELARAIFQKVKTILPPEVQNRVLNPVVPPSRQWCSRRLALTEWNLAQIYSNVSEMMDAPPFTNQFDFETRKNFRDQKLRTYKRKNSASFAEAFQVYRKVVDRAPDDLYFRMTFANLLQARRDFTGAAEMWKLLLTQIPNRASWHEQLGHVISEGGDQQNAIKRYRRAMKILPGLVRPHIWIGTALGKQGKLDEAEVSFRSALKLSPRSVAVHHHLGGILEDLERTKEAKATFSSGLKISRRQGDRKSEGEFLKEIAQLYFKQGELDLALLDYRRALEIAREIRNSPGEANLLGDIGNVYFSQGKFKESLGSHRQALEVFTQDGDSLGCANVLFDMGGVYFRDGRINDAQSSFEGALELYRYVEHLSGQAQALGSIGNIYLGKDDLERVLQVNKEALKIYEKMNDSDGRSRSLTRIGNLYLKQGRSAESLNYHSQAFEIHKKNGQALGQADALSNMGIGFSNQGKRQEALDLLRQARAIYQRIGARLGLNVANEMIAELEKK